MSENEKDAGSCRMAIFNCMCVSQVGDRDDSNLYISTKLKAAAEVTNIHTLVFLS